MRVGRLLVTENRALVGPRWIINFPTKKHWRQPSKLEWVRDGLRDLGRVLRENKIQSVALPPLGCGNGGLDWVLVRREIEGRAWRTRRRRRGRVRADGCVPERAEACWSDIAYSRQGTHCGDGEAVLGSRARMHEPRGAEACVVFAPCDRQLGASRSAEPSVHGQQIRPIR